MLNLHIITTGKLKESYWAAAEAEYLKRLRPYAKITWNELPEVAFRDVADREKIKAQEAQKIAKILPAGATVIALHETGREFTSIKFAEFLQTLCTRGETVAFVVGGPLGLHESILQLAHYQLSLSTLTFPHQMVRSILLEQIYRAVTILQGKQYHY